MKSQVLTLISYSAQFHFDLSIHCRILVLPHVEALWQPCNHRDIRMVDAFKKERLIPVNWGKHDQCSYLVYMSYLIGFTRR